MSGRMVKRLLKQQELEDTDPQSNAENSDGEEEDDASTAAVNPFDLLGGDEEGVADNISEADEDELQYVNEKHPTVASNIEKENKERKKGKKKKKKGKSKPLSTEHQPTEDLDKILRELKVEDDSMDNRAASSGAPSDQSGSSSTADVSWTSVLAADPRHLKADDELRRIFGSRALVDSPHAAHRRSYASNPRGSQRIRSLRRFLLVDPPPEWPLRPHSGLSMELCGSQSGVQTFRFVFSDEYEAVQKLYLSCVESHDPNSLVSLVARYPFHVDALLALAEVYKSMGEHQGAADLLQRSLFAIESAWHPGFDPRRGTCRLEYSVEENRSFFHALFRHMQHLSRRGCHRTALETCKLLLSLDPVNDPMGALQCIDYHAIRAEQFHWLLRFAAVFPSSSPLGLFPNFAFSLAVARQKVESGEAKGVDLPQEDEDERVDSREMLREALMLHPTVLGRLVEKAPVKVDSDWSRLLGHRAFAGGTAGGPSLEHLVELYAVRNSVVWREAGLQAWLKDGARSVVEAADRPGGKAELSDWAAVRKAAFPSDANEYRHLFLADFSDSVATLPPEEIAAMQAAAGGGVMLPRAEMMMGPPPVQHEQPAQRQLDPSGQNPVLVFLQAMLPWNDFGEAGENGGDLEIEDLPEEH